MSLFSLFNEKGTVHDFLTQKKSQLRKEIEKLEEDYILNENEEDLRQVLISNFTLEVPSIQEETRHASDLKEIDLVGRKGVQYTLSFSFTGDAILFYYLPSMFRLPTPRGRIMTTQSGQELQFIYEMDKDDPPDLLEKRLTNDLDEVQKHLKFVETDINQFNESLESLVRNGVRERKERISGAYNSLKTLKIPIKRRKDLPDTYNIPLKRKKLKITSSQGMGVSSKPEPTLDLKKYEHILEILQDMNFVIEKSPNAFTILQEPEIRTFFLLFLNGYYEGQATGETFNFRGRTDILINVQGKNVFIAECKFWDGEKKFLDTIDQLLGYLSWRDTKTAIILFVKKNKFRPILKKIKSAIEKHELYKNVNPLKSAKLIDESILSYIFGQTLDPNRKIFLTVMAFHMPTSYVHIEHT